MATELGGVDFKGFGAFQNEADGWIGIIPLRVDREKFFWLFVIIKGYMPLFCRSKDEHSLITNGTKDKASSTRRI